MKRSLTLTFVLLTLLLAGVAGAAELPGRVTLAMDPSPADLARFESYVEALESSSDLSALAETGRHVLNAIEAQDYEAFLAAGAIHGYRLETLDDGALKTLHQIEQKLLARHPETLSTLATPVDKVNVNYGCGAQLTCDNGSTISCTCANGQPFNQPPSSCVYKPNYNAYGGRVICDCSGTSFDRTRTCPYVPPTSCSPGCFNECGSTGGQCFNGTCYCY